MFRCITEIRGLAFDIDGFGEDEIEEIYRLFHDYNALFMTASDDKELILKKYYSSDKIYKMENFQEFLAPNKLTHAIVLDRLKIKATELVYVSKRSSFLNNAMGFLGGTAWITDTITYEQASKAPDLICSSLERLVYSLENDVKGFLGEITVFPYNGKTMGTVIPVRFESDQGVLPLFMLGRYFSYTQYMSQKHPYSTAIYLNKKRDSKAYGAYREDFQRLILQAAKRIIQYYKIDGICAVPARPNHEDRFAEILSNISRNLNITNFGADLVCSEDYPSQKELSAEERKENIKGVFSFRKKLNGEAVIIIDDIVTTGSTINECINVLKAAGAGDIYIIVLAINQYGVEYWSSNSLYIVCPKCGGRMRLLINSKNKSFFYTCTESFYHTIEFEAGRRQLIEGANLEFGMKELEFE